MLLRIFNTKDPSYIVLNAKKRKSESAHSGAAYASCNIVTYTQIHTLIERKKKNLTRRVDILYWLVERHAKCAHNHSRVSGQESLMCDTSAQISITYKRTDCLRTEYAAAFFTFRKCYLRALGSLFMHAKYRNIERYGFCL